ncbi:MAG TPA: winged helix-turn-helix domain-containing protein [Burkholderiaceae bacterium]|nr:winged helix-turn-helix domain-containing protein [Burkholderiaceae bacterium]
MTNATTYRFGPCELDEARRSLRAHGREIRLQPRVFDLLCYLVRHRDRVVPKDELLEALWPGAIVVDNALQRVVSLARGALAELGLGEAVRTYSRHGYRFCLDDAAEAAPGDAAVAATDRVAEARAACDRNEWGQACAAYAAADAQSALPPDDVEHWGRAAICAGLGPSVVAALERVAAQRNADRDALGAARATLLLVQIRIDHKQSVIARGLLQRAARYLEGRSASVERGHFAWMASRMALGNGDAALALAMADEACSLGRSLRDPDVECLGLAYRGHALMARGEVANGLAQHEEAAAVIQLGGVRSWVAGWALCSILYAARHRCDWLRAAQFAEAYLEWSRACSMPAFPGTCQLHRAAVLGVRGELERAASEVRAAAALLAHAAPWAEGDAYCVLGDIQLSHGDLDGAEASFRQAHALGWDPQPGLARLHLLTGRPALAQRGLEQALQEADWTLRERRGQLLCLLVHACVAAGDVERAREALQMLRADPQMLATEALMAMHCGAEAELARHDADPKLAAQKLRQAVRHWRDAGSPVGEAETRMRLAECLLEDRDATGTELELHAMESHLAAVAMVHRARLGALRDALRELRAVASR